MPDMAVMTAGHAGAVRYASNVAALHLEMTAQRSGSRGHSMLQPASRTLWPERPPQISVSAPAWLSVLDVDSDGTVVRAHLVRPDERIPHPPHRAERAYAQHENRGLTFWHEDDGTVVLHGRFPPEMGARILGALDAAMQAHATEQPASGWDNEGSAPEDVPGGTSVQGSSFADATINTRARETVSGRQRQDAQLFLADVPRGTFIRGPSRTVRRADPLTWVAERMFEPGDAPALAPDRHEIVVHVEAEVLADGRAGRCEIQHRAAIAAETARRLCCDAGIVPVVDGANGEPLSVGRRTRSIPPAVRRALLSRDHGCRFPGCPATHRLHGHHVQHWANGGETSLDNLVLLGPTHHRAWACRPYIS